MQLSVLLDQSGKRLEWKESCKEVPSVNLGVSPGHGHWGRCPREEGFGSQTFPLMVLQMDLDSSGTEMVLLIHCKWSSSHFKWDYQMVSLFKD